MERSVFGRHARVLALGLALAVLPPVAGGAEGRSRDRDRERFYGRVEVMPKDFHGTWVIGGREVTTHPRTEFDQADGPLAVGACAKVDTRNGLVHEIDSEPARDCR